MKVLNLHSRGNLKWSSFTCLFVVGFFLFLLFCFCSNCCSLNIRTQTKSISYFTFPLFHAITGITNLLCPLSGFHFWAKELILFNVFWIESVSYKLYNITVMTSHFFAPNFNNVSAVILLLCRVDVLPLFLGLATLNNCILFENFVTSLLSLIPDCIQRICKFIHLHILEECHKEKSYLLLSFISKFQRVPKQELTSNILGFFWTFSKWSC